MHTRKVGMSRRPPCDSSSSFQPVAASAPRGRPYTSPPVRSRNFSGYQSPFQQPVATGISSLVDFREGVQILDDNAGSHDFLEYNGKNAYVPPVISSVPPPVLESEDVEVTDHDLRRMIDNNLKMNTARKTVSLQPTNEMRSRTLQGHAARGSSDSDKRIEKMLAELERMKKENDTALHNLKPVSAHSRSHGHAHSHSLDTSSSDKQIKKLLSDLERMKRENDARQHATSPNPVASPFVSRTSRLSTDAYRSMVRA